MQNASFNFNGFQWANRRLDLNWRPLGCVEVIGDGLSSHGSELWPELWFGVESGLESELDSFLIFDLRFFVFAVGFAGWSIIWTLTLVAIQFSDA